MTDVLITLLLSQPAKHFPQLITDKSRLIIISHDITLLNICSLTPDPGNLVFTGDDQLSQNEPVKFQRIKWTLVLKVFIYVSSTKPFKTSFYSQLHAECSYITALFTPYGLVCCLQIIILIFSVPTMKANNGGVWQ